MSRPIGLGRGGEIAEKGGKGGLKEMEGRGEEGRKRTVGEIKDDCIK